MPGTKHGTREVFEEQVILQGCKATGALDAMVAANGGAIRNRPRAIAWHCAPMASRSTSTGTILRLWRASKPIQTGSVCLAWPSTKTTPTSCKWATMSGVVPSVESISAGEYPVSRPLYFYIKAAHLDVIPGLKDFAEFFVSDDIAGPDGPLAEYGLVSDPRAGGHPGSCG